MDCGRAISRYFDILKISENILTDYDTVIYGRSLHAVGINGINYIKQNMEKLKDKKIVVFATGATPYREDTINEVRNKNFTFNEQKLIQFFYLRGGFDYSKLSLFDKVLMILLKLKIKIKKKNELKPDEKGMLMAYDKPVDFTSKKNI